MTFLGARMSKVAREPAANLKHTDGEAAPKPTTASRTFEPNSPDFYRKINDIEHWKFNVSAVEIGQVPEVASVVDFMLIPDLSPEGVERDTTSKYGASHLVFRSDNYACVTAGMHF